MLTGDKAADEAIRDLVTSLTEAMKSEKPTGVELGAGIERSFARLVKEVVRLANQKSGDALG